MSEWVERAAMLAKQLSEAQPDPGLYEQAATTLRGLALEVERAELILDTRLEELAAVREMLAALSYPVIEVAVGVLCVPIVGPVDATLMEGIIENVLNIAAQRRARAVIIDLTGAQFGDIVTADALGRLFRTLRLVGVDGAVSGLSPTLAQALAELGTPLGVSTHASLAAALAATSDHSSKTR